MGKLYTCDPKSCYVNGLGNLVIGYDELIDWHDPGNKPICSDGQWQSQDDCLTNGGVWEVNHKSGSHNVVIGPGHRYLQGVGLIAGAENTVNRHGGSVSGGSRNTASNDYSAVSGGWTNTASGNSSAVSGGYSREAQQTYDWVAGGLFQEE